MLFLRLPVLLLAGLGVAVVGYYLFLVSGLIARRRELEIVLLRSRGLSIFQVIHADLHRNGRERSILTWGVVGHYDEIRKFI